MLLLVILIDTFWMFGAVLLHAINVRGTVFLRCVIFCSRISHWLALADSQFLGILCHLTSL